MKNCASRSHSIYRLFPLLALAIGCSGESESEIQFEEYDESASILRAPLGAVEEGCWEDDAAKTFPSSFPRGAGNAYKNPSDTYPSGNCTAAFLVDVTDAQAYDVDYSQWGVYIDAANLPIAPAECARWRIGVETWNKYSDGTYNFFGGRFRWAEWSEQRNKCVTTVPVSWAQDWPLRIGATVRRHATAGSVTSSYVTKKIALWYDGTNR